MRKKYVNKKGTGICSGKEKKNERKKKARREKRRNIGKTKHKKVIRAKQ